MTLYSNNNPKTTIKGFGYKDKKTALETIKKVEKTKREQQCIIVLNIINIEQKIWKKR